MANILLLSDCYPENMTNGMHLRARYLAEELCRAHRCFFIGLSQGEPPSNIYDIPFADAAYLGKRPRNRSWPMRHFRLSNSHYLERTRPEYFDAAVAEVGRLVRDWEVDGLIHFAPNLGEISVKLGVPAILDYPDCATLTIERKMNNATARLTRMQLIQLQTERMRNRLRDRWLIRNYDRTTTISGPDAERLIEVSGVDRSRVIVVPNGVAERTAMAPDSRKSTNRTVVFWGNLDFPPNHAAVMFFHDQVFLPYLAEHGVTWHIVGKGADSTIQRIGEHPGIFLDGFVDDLDRHVSSMGVMVNPMVEGSGLKNKVLEAFALRLPVVTTSMGVDAIDGTANEHFLVADSPGYFADHILKLLDDSELAGHLAAAGTDLVDRMYTWSAVGKRMNTALESVLTERCAA